ncbi:monovalent cation/H(+) antiporter subunit G [uncultured Bosea sp.]|uniref:monovalent cation/H(+) antiporter subunit G n=1 Tax=uncultured Bosea sp. TaxID=211457 RepID=UPI0025EEB3B5|nr:monovalent cation/H(+) antiporter subunit G [uncultured Bosea sp.]
MSGLADIATIVLVSAGALLFLAGALGLLRFPDTLSRLHAISKADNLGLGLIVLGLLPQMASLAGGLKLLCIWLLAQLSAATASQLLARAVHRDRADR